YGLRGCITRTSDKQQQLRIYRDYAIGCADLYDVLHVTIYKSVIDAKKAFYSFYCNYNPMVVETAGETTETITEITSEITLETTSEDIENISDIFSIDIIDQQLYADPEISLDDMVGADIIDQQLYADNENEAIKYYALFETMFEEHCPNREIKIVNADPDSVVFEIKDSFDFQIKSISQDIEEAMRQFYIYLGDMRVIISIHNIYKRAYQFTLK
ncbi:MAG TPA: hypothetical protein V6C58_03625, partial [Allocoleopsis sp.]